MVTRTQDAPASLDNAGRISRKEQFRAAADYVASTFAKVSSVRRVALFGSVASDGKQPVQPRRPHWRLHDPKDVDIAVWLDDVQNLDELRTGRSHALSQLFAATEIGVAHHQVDVFILSAKGDYLGRLCCFNCCPKGKPECEVKDCGKTPFLRQHDNFRLDPYALSQYRIKILYERKTSQ